MFFKQSGYKPRPRTGSSSSQGSNSGSSGSPPKEENKMAAAANTRDIDTAAANIANSGTAAGAGVGAANTSTAGTGTSGAGAGRRRVSFVVPLDCLSVLPSSFCRLRSSGFRFPVPTAPEPEPGRARVDTISIKHCPQSSCPLLFVTTYLVQPTLSFSPMQHSLHMTRVPSPESTESFPVCSVRSTL